MKIFKNDTPIHGIDTLREAMFTDIVKKEWSLWYFPRYKFVMP